MPRLGEILVEMGACEPERIREALDTQVLLGGRLGTNLLELGALDEATLAAALARRHGTPARHGDIDVDPAAAALLKAEHADRFDAIPCALSARRLSVLCCDPSDLASLDAIAFATGKDVEPIVVPEARLFALLRAHYHLQRPLRGLEVPGTRRRPSSPSTAAVPVAAPEPAAGPADLMDEDAFEALYGGGAPSPGNAAGSAAPASSQPERGATAGGRGAPPPLPPRRPAPPGGAAAAAAPVSPPGEAPPPGAGREAASVPAGAAASPEANSERAAAADAASAEGAIAGAASDARGPAEATAALEPLTFAEAAAALAGVADREAVATIVLRFARPRFPRVILLAVHGAVADGWCGVGDGVTPERVARIRVPVSEPGVVQTVVQSRSHFLGPLPRTDANVALLRALAGGAPRSAFAMPISARGRVVNVLYADGGRGGFVDADAVGELLILAARIAQGYDAMIANRR